MRILVAGGAGFITPPREPGLRLEARPASALGAP
jgi:hypothetical protein